MTTEKIYGPPIDWNGGECPVPPDTRVKVKYRFAGLERSGLAKEYYWRHCGDGSDIVKYSTIVEQSDLEAAEKLPRENWYTIVPPAKPLTFEDVTPMTEAPKKGTWYWVTQPFMSRGVEAFAWGGDEYDLAALRHRMAYLDKEHALIAARHIFGLKGGEL